jgi:hypothetical protein
MFQLVAFCWNGDFLVYLQRVNNFLMLLNVKNVKTNRKVDVGWARGGLWVLNATLNNNLVISWHSVFNGEGNQSN